MRCKSTQQTDTLQAGTLHSQQLALTHPPDLRLMYPPHFEHLNPQHFHQVSIQQWLARQPRPLTIDNFVTFGRTVSKGKVLASANHVAEELTIRFAYRLRNMQMLPYRLMGHPSLLHVYEQYLDSFEMLRRIGRITTLEQNAKLVEIGQQLLQKHTRVVTDVIFGMRDILSRSHRHEDEAVLNELTKKMLTSRLSRRVLVKQHTLLTQFFEGGEQTANFAPNRVGEITLDCRIVDMLDIVEERAKKTLSRIFGVPVDEMPRVTVEGTPADLDATFPYIERHFEFALGELLFNSLEACLQRNVKDAIVLTVSATHDSVLVRISDRAGGLDELQEEYLWSFADTTGTSAVITRDGLTNHQFFSLLFPAEEVPGYEHANASSQPDASHFSLGLALSKLYVEYWGGALELQSIDGFGCDALLRVSRRGRNRENLLISDRL